ncbi:MAG: hypothetical protein ACREPU_14330, partial [Rhodanobacteraceae bacterium]
MDARLAVWPTRGKDMFTRFTTASLVLLLLTGAAAAANPAPSTHPAASASQVPPAPASASSTQTPPSANVASGTMAPNGAPALTSQDLRSFFDALVPYMLKRNDIAGGVIAVVKDGHLIF